MLARHGVPWIAIDRAPRLVAAVRRQGHNVILGDAARPDVLDRLGLDTALAVVVTMDSSEATEAVVATARSLAPDLAIVARSRDTQQAGHLYQLGASDVVPETIEASLRLSEALLSRIGMPSDAVVASIRQRRDEFRHQAGNAETANRQGRRAPRR